MQHPKPAVIYSQTLHGITLGISGPILRMFEYISFIFMKVDGEGGETDSGSQFDSESWCVWESSI